ncbi:hypothetical protein CcaverHIS002_0201180 [Cutaneotrichosporon cavernicola]|nr:hypothetical protein CcaverHIS002_0201180 [Cutaneotrichosporon cavernicola]
MSARNLPASAPRTPASSVRRPPPALRGAPGSRGRVAAAISVSLVFAHGDAVQADVSASEEALSRQLDRDTAGERMSLRSRRSSVATLSSMRTDCSSHLLASAVPEEDEAGPSISRSPYPHDPTSSASLPHDTDSSLPATPRMRRRRASSRRSVPHRGSPTPSISEQRAATQERRDSACVMCEPGPTTPRLNPKQSGAWLRWNSPAPSFPKKDKGKARAESPGAANVATMVTAADPAPPSPRTLTSVDHRGGDKARKASSKLSPTPRPPKSLPPPKPEATPAEPPAPTSTADILAAPPPVEGSLQPPAEILSARSSSEAQRPRSRSPSTSAAPAQGWGSYLASWVYPSSAPAGQAGLPASTTLITTEPEAIVEHDESTSAIELSNPAEEQKPIAENEHPAADFHTSEPEIELPPDEPHLAPPPSPQPKYATSTTSTSGWLSYLAFRATQKRITASTRTLDGEEIMDLENDPDFPQSEGNHPKTTGPGLSRETSHSKATGVNLSRQASLSQAGGKGGAPVKATGANLLGQASHSHPAASDKVAGSQSKATAGSVKDKPTESRAEDRRDSAAALQHPSPQKLAHKRSQNLSVNRSRRLSNASSTCTAGSGSQPVASASPRVAQGNGQASKGASDLPGPAKAAPKQQNFVIPTFDITFDRPPRSLLPRHPEPPGAAGLALRAFNYVYNTQRADPPDETRGKKAGRDIGATLPRRMGLGSGSSDDGWRDVERVVVIGVHGWFPAKMLTSVIGEPTGTSTKFANMMGEAVRKFFKERDVDEHDIRLTLIPLEGEGTIEHRVDRLYKQYLSNPAWINDLRRADAVLFAAHSQGCIVTTHLISRMIAQGHLRTTTNREATARCEWAFGPIGIMPNEESRKGRQLAARMSGREGGRQKVAVLAMCGVHLGPFYSISTSSVIQPYLQWFENAAARELFEFQDSTSAVSVAYQRALAMILENEVKILLLSSLNDQVVPIYGASFSTASHPLLLRALYVDGASYSASDFMTNLLCFAFMLRNAGIDDQRLIEHLSEATAGSLTGVGHSTPYEELGCYSLAVQYLFHTGPAAQPMPPLEVEPFAARDSRNDFELPWIMRALVDSPEVKDLFADELRTLKDNILAWKPNTKALKEIKKRLEPMAGRQRPSPLSQLAKSGSSTSLASDATGVVPGTAHARSHANTRKPPAPAPKAVMTMVGR